ncbi:MAG: DUF2236 domain-containing protein [Actinomycetota bacterium]|nr:DUF2236 domain-containing protein [Actinomycetota bacterium]
MALPTFDDVTRPARNRLADTLRDKVAGEDAEVKARAIWLAEGERWFTPDDPIWRVHDDAAMFVGGLRALLLQSLHPLAMAGVAGHSGYKSDPWGRLQRTSEYIASTTFGTVEVAQASIDRVRSIHERVRGRAADGRPYAASDPHLLAWVHAAEVDSFLSSHQRHGRVPLTPTEADHYVWQSARAATALGVLDAPRSVADLERVLAAYRLELVGSPEAHETARFLLLQPPVSGVSRLGYGVLAAGAIALLPVWAKAMLRLPALPLVDRLVTHHVAGLGVDTIRWALTDPGRTRPGTRPV